MDRFVIGNFIIVNFITRFIFQIYYTRSYKMTIFESSRQTSMRFFWEI